MSVKWKLAVPDHHQILLDRGLNQMMLADQLGIKQPYISAYIYGRPIPAEARVILDAYFHNDETRVTPMKKNEFSGIQANIINDGKAMELIFDFGSGPASRHHGGCINKDLPKASLVHLLRIIANNIENDEAVR